MKALPVFAALTLALAACTDRAPARPDDETSMQKAGTIDYVEFAAADLAAFKRFYGETLGWSFQDWGPDYASFSGAGIEGGVRGGEPARAGTTLVILYADDLDAMERKLVDAGAKILERHEFPGGWRFHYEDPSGNVLAVWTKSEG